MIQKSFASVRKIRFEEFPNLLNPELRRVGRQMTALAKRTTDVDGRQKYLKIDGERSAVQYAVNEAKKFFGVDALDVELVFDLTSQSLGCFVGWIDCKSSCHQVAFSWIFVKENFDQFFRIVLMDGVLGNCGRFGRNLLIRTNGRIIGIDEALAFNYRHDPRPEICGKALSNYMLLKVSSRRRWVGSVVEEVTSNSDAIAQSLLRCGVRKPFVEVALFRLGSLEKVVPGLFSSVKKERFKWWGLP